MPENTIMSLQRPVGMMHMICPDFAAQMPMKNGNASPVVSGNANTMPDVAYYSITAHFGILGMSTLWQGTFPRGTQSIRDA